MIQFSSEKISKHVIRIKDCSDVCEYLILGKNRALLIDTGYGIGDIKEYVESIVDTPVDVFITHGHLDHASGAGLFKTVHMNLLDLELFKIHSSIPFRKQFLKEKGFIFADELFVENREISFLNIDDLEIVDLGNVHVKFIAVPGHTQGCMVPIILEDRIAVFGDACGVGVLLLQNESTTVKEYLNSLLHLKEYGSEYDVVLRQHGSFRSSKKVLDDNIENCRNIISQIDDHEKSLFMNQTVYWSCKRDKDGKRIDGREGNICYSPDRI